jgi:hypothetical protein
VNWLHLLAFGSTVLLTTQYAWSAEFPSIHALAKGRWGEPVTDVQKITSGHLAICFPAAAVYRMQVRNPYAMIVGPPMRTVSIVVQGRDAAFIENENDAVGYFSQSTLKVRDGRASWRHLAID